MRANRELGADFDLDGFAHEAIFNAEKSRIEMHLVSQQAQTVSLLGKQFRLPARRDDSHREARTSSPCRGFP